MTRPVRLGEHAAAEFAEAVRWYEERTPGVGVKFLAAVQQALRRIETRPEAGSPVPRSQRSAARRVVLRRFPYQLIYYVRDSEIAVVAVAHTKRRPGYWKRRT